MSLLTTLLSDSSGGGGGGGVTSVSSGNANRITVANGTTTPVINAPDSPVYVGMNLSGLTASQAVVTDASKNLASLAYATENTAGALVQRDSNANIIANKVSTGIAINAPGGTTTVNLTAASAPIQYLTTSVIFTEVLPNATTLNNGDVYSFVCLASTSFAVNTFGGGALLSGIPVGWRNDVQLQDNSTSAGTWKIINTCPINGTYPLTQFGAFGSTPISTGASTSTRTITLQPANATNPGGVSIVAQSFAGQKTFTAGGIVQPFSTLTDAATVAVDLSLNNNFNLVTTSGVGATRALGIPTNPVAGQNGIITVRQDSAGSRALTYTWPYIFPSLSAPVLSLGKGAMDLLSYIVLSYSTATATMTIATPCVVTWAGHGLVHGQRVAFTTTGALPTGVTANVGYYINVIDANTFNLATSLANLQAATYVATSGSQSGTHTATNMVIEITANLNNGA